MLKKWLNLKSKDLDLGASLAADDDDDDDGSDVDGQGTYGHGWPPRPHLLRRVSVPGSPYLTFIHSGARPEGQRQRLSPLCPLTSCCLALLRQRTAAVTTAALAGRTMTATAPRSPVRSTNSFTFTCASAPLPSIACSTEPRLSSTESAFRVSGRPSMWWSYLLQKCSSGLFLAFFFFVVT